jgi:hypothetical protein
MLQALKATQITANWQKHNRSHFIAKPAPIPRQESQISPFWLSKQYVSGP